MNITAKLALTIAAISTMGNTIVANPAAAEPNVGSTAAAVSIVFQDPGTTGGNFSLAPNGSINSNVNGVKEISAAVATGETRSIATAGNKTANAEGFSQPTTFRFNTFNDAINGATSTTRTGTNYDYAGSTAGLSFIPVVK